MVVLLLLTACTKSSFDSEKEFYSWINDVDNGFVKVQKSNSFMLETKHLPASYLGYIEWKRKDEDNRTLKHYNDLVTSFKDSKTFTITISHEDKVDPTYYDVWNMPEYKERIKELNFNMKEHIYVKTDDGSEIAPVLATMENIYHIASKKTLYLVFPNNNNQLNTSEKLDIVFEDTFLKTGISHFEFSNKDFEQLPTFNFIKHGITN